MSTRKTVVVIGGGASGTLTAYHLARQENAPHVIVVDPRPKLGLGLAYSTTTMRHLLNVPAWRINAVPGRPNHFLDWLRANHDPDATHTTFAPRAIFGLYLQSLIAATPEVVHVPSEAIGYRPCSSGGAITLSDGTELVADLIVLALGNFEPAPLRGVSSETIEQGFYCHDAWAARTYEGIDADATVVLIGTGLTGVDALLRLRDQGHRGTVIGVSRHGLMPQRHAPYQMLDAPAIPEDTPATALHYLRAFRAAVHPETEWRGVVDSLRPKTNELWLALPYEEQMRFHRHLKRRWDVLRHRMAPPIADEIDRELEAGSLVLCAGHLQAVKVDDGQAIVKLRTGEELRAARVINCTGASLNYRALASPLLHSLFQQGAATLGALGGGLRSDATGALLFQDGTASQTLFTLGPPRLGTLFESIAIPEISVQASALAEFLIEKMAPPGKVDFHITDARAPVTDAPPAVGA